jgi:arylsulfatase A-like enzyme
MSDDHTSQAISAYGGILAEVCPTPNIDRLAQEGMLFHNCFVTNSICTPSRAAIMTGTYAHKNGVYKFTALDQSQPMLPKMLQESGYNTALVGKYHLHSNPVGLDHFSVLPGQGDYHNPEFIETGNLHPSGWIQQAKMTRYQGHSSDVIADRALEFLIEKRDKDKPFMLFCHFKAPHDNWEYAERYSDFLEDVEIPEPETLFDDYDGRSDALKNTLQYIGSSWGNHTNFLEETAHLEGVAKKKMQYQLYMKKYLRCVKGVDDNVGRILEYLDQSGLAKNTMVVYTGDQGFYLGEHGLYDKRFMYEEALRMPFLMRWPDQIEEGSVSEGMILNVDFAPTLLEAAGLEAHPEMQGRSFMPLTEGNIPPDWRESMYYRYYYSHFETEPHFGIRTTRYKLICFDRIGQWELYDLENDPIEMKNLYDHPDYQELVAELKDELMQLQMQLGDDPDDTGERPNIGDLAPDPVHTVPDVNVADGENTILARFRTRTGGTLFSRCDLTTDPDGEDFDDNGIKSLLVTSEGLTFFDEYERTEIDCQVADNQWHTVAVVINDRMPSVYLDGNLIHSGEERMAPDTPGHSFHIGGGLNDGGYLGYNFQGDISEVVVFNSALGESAIEEYANGNKPEGQPVLAWQK